MNFVSEFMDDVIAEAKEAVEAVQDFKGFDEMAEEDDYIHSEDLNVVNYAQEEEEIDGEEEEDEEAPKEETQSYSESNISAEPTWSLLDRPVAAVASIAPSAAPAPSNAASANARGRPMSRNASTISSTSPASSISPPPRQQKTSKPPADATSYFSTPPAYSSSFSQQQQSASSTPRCTATTMPLLSVVADALESGSITNQNRQQSSFSGYDTDNEESSRNNNNPKGGDDSSSSSDDSSDEEDVIMSQIRQGRKSKKKKNPNRFMEELAALGSGSGTASEFAKSMQQDPHANTATPSAGGLSSSLKKWINPFQQNGSNDTTGSLAAKATSFLNKGPLSRPPADVYQAPSVLSNNELDALAHMNPPPQESKFSPKDWMKKIKASPREAFVVFTMVLAIFVFFFSRKRSNEDDVQ